MLEVNNLRKTFATGEGTTVRAVDGVSFTVEPGKAFTLLGPSGCGKTTTLRCVAGLERPSAGAIRVAGTDVYDSGTNLFVRPERRRIGMVFQSYAIWPHMNVFDNVAFPLRIAKMGRREIRERVAGALDMVKLGELARRDSTKLSGGQQQRLAVARALVQEPDLLLLDEPLSNLDAKLREQMRVELKALQRDLGLTMLYVTHDQLEAIVLSDSIAVMREGRIVQIGNPREIYDNPTNRYVADFIGNTNLIPGRVAEAISDDRYRIETALGTLVGIAGQALSRDQDVLVSLRPENISLTTEAPTDPEGTNVWRVTIEDQTFQGESTFYTVTHGGQTIRVRANPNLDLARGRTAYASTSPQHCVGVPATLD